MNLLPAASAAGMLHTHFKRVCFKKETEKQLLLAETADGEATELTGAEGDSHDGAAPEVKFCSSKDISLGSNTLPPDEGRRSEYRAPYLRNTLSMRKEHLPPPPKRIALSV